MAGATPKANTIFSGRSRIGLNSANFFQAEAVGIILPVLNGFLRDSHWRYDAIGVATAIAGLGTLLFQTPAGLPGCVSCCYRLCPAHFRGSIHYSSRPG